MFKVDKTSGDFTLYKNSPAHLFIDYAYYIITAHTIRNIRPFIDDERKQLLLDSIILNFVERNNWNLIAYFIGDNHYHLLLKATEHARNLSKIIGNIHRFTSLTMNKQNNSQGRKIWYQYWDTVITSQKSLYARFNYIHYNPVKHGFVEKSEEYKFCSFKHFYESDKIQVDKLIKKYPFDRVKVNEP